MGFTDRQVARFLSKFVVAETGCWDWIGSSVGRKRDGQYGQFYLAPPHQYVYAHRFGYELWVGPIPAGLQLDHLCRNRKCVNPEHLEAVTPRVNNLRGLPYNRKTHCKNGHPLVPYKQCATCRRAYVREYNREYNARADIKEYRLEYSRKWAEQNREHRRQWFKQWREKKRNGIRS